MNNTINHSTKPQRSRILRKLSAVVLSAAMLGTSLVGLSHTALVSAQAASATPSATSVPQASSALPNHIYDGVILHAWNWSFNSIKSNLPAIAAAGYTAVQTSPVQRPKDYSNTSTSQWDWWKVYQPTTLSFSPGGHPWFGSKEEFKAMCDEADKYGIKIIVDVVANHLANNNGGEGNNRNGISSQNDPTYRDDNSCWHLNGSMGIDYGNPRRDGSTSSLTHGFGGWPDLNTGNKKVQNGVLDLLKECIDLGADGFRFDAAKHIELPTDPGGASDFWPTVINGAEQYAASKGREIYCYGEILDDAGTDIKNYTKYMGVTDNRASKDIRKSIVENNIGKAANSWLNHNGVPYSKIVLWAESHDTYANDDYTGESTESSQDQINRAWAIVAARQFPALYYIRPDNPRSQRMGQASGNTAWKNTEVAEVNKFHNAFVGESEYMSSSGSTVLIERGTTGVVLVNISGYGQQFSGKVNKMKDGTYKDQVSGGTFTVSGGVISGTIGNKGIAVVYNAGSYGSVSATPDSTSFTDSITVSLTANNVTNAKYTTSEGASGSFSTGTTITMGGSTAVGGSVTLTLSGTKQDGSAVSAKYTYLKKNPNEVTTLYFDNSSYNWSKVYAYIYNKTNTDDPIPVPPPVPSSKILFTNSLHWGSVYAYFFNSNGTVGNEWPGQTMTNIGDNGYGNTNFSIDIPNGANMVVFNNGAGTQTKNLSLSGVAGYWLDGSPDKAIPWYSTSSSAATTTMTAEDTTPCNAPWPGQLMTKDDATGYYTLVVPKGFENGLVIFSDGAENTTKRYPADMEDGLPINDTSKLFSANYSWKEYVAPVPEKLSVTLTASPANVNVGDTVTLTASAAHASGTVTYTYQVGSQTLSATGASATWTPTEAGTFTVTVTAKDSKNTATASKTVTVTAAPVKLSVTLKASPASVNVGDTVTLTASAANASGTVAYTYKVGSQTLSASGSSVEWSPSEAGTFTITVTAKDSQGTATASQTVTVTDKPAPALLANRSTLSSKETIDFVNRKSVTVYGVAAGGTAPYQYAYFYKKSTSENYIRIQAYSEDTSVEFVPKSTVSATYNIKVKVKDSNGSIKSKVLNVKAIAPAKELVNKSTVSASTIKIGSSLTVKCAASGGTSPYQYAVYYKKSSSDNYSTVQSYSTTNTVTIKPTLATVYNIRVKVKDKKGKVATADFDLTVTDPDANRLKNTSKVSRVNIPLGESTIVYASAEDGAGSYQYAVYYKRGSDGEFQALQTYSTKSKITFKPAHSGVYYLRTKVKDKKGTVVNKDIRITVTLL